MELLHLFLTEPSLSLNELVSLSEMPKTSVHRMASSLEETGFLTRRGRPLSAWSDLLQFGQLVSERLDIRKIAKPIMEELCGEVDEAVQLIMRDGDEAIYVEKLKALKPSACIRQSAAGRRCTRERAPEAFYRFCQKRRLTHTFRRQSLPQSPQAR